MSTTTLSQRLRAMYQEMRRHSDRIPGWDTNLFFEAIAQAEAMESQAGELSVERIMQAVKRAGSQMPYGHINYDMIRAELTKVVPVVTHLAMDPNASPETIEAVEDVVQKAYSYKPPSQAIGKQTPVAWMASDESTITSQEKRRMSLGSAAETHTASGHSIPLYRSPLSPEARDIDPSELVSIDKAMSIIKEEVTPYILEKTFPDELPRLWIILKNKLLEVLPFKE